MKAKLTLMHKEEEHRFALIVTFYEGCPTCGKAKEMGQVYVEHRAVMDAGVLLGRLRKLVRLVEGEISKENKP